MKNLKNILLCGAANLMLVAPVQADNDFGLPQEAAAQIHAFCTQVSQAAGGGSYQIEEACMKMEARSYHNLHPQQ